MNQQNKITFLHFLPLIGPFILAQKKLEKEGLLLESKGIYSFPDFKNNEQHITHNDSSLKINYFENEDYEKLITRDSSLEDWVDLVKKHGVPSVNILTGLPICSGLSMLNSNNNSCSDTGKARGCDAIQNNWMFSVLKLYLATNSDVMVIENAPGLATVGLPLLNRMKTIINDNGFNRKIQLVKTSTFHHGIPQNRIRTFVIIHKNENYIRLNNKIHPYLTLEEYLSSMPYKDNDPCYFNTKEYPELSEFMRFIKEHPEFIEEFKRMPSPKVKPLWKLILPHVEKNPDLLNGYEELSNTFKHIMKKKSMDKGFWDGSPTLVKGHVNAVISKNRLAMFNPLDNYQSLFKIRHFMHLMGLPIDFDLKDPERSWKHITQNVPVNTAADSLLWAIECLNNENEIINESVDDQFIICDNSKGNVYNTILDSSYKKIQLEQENSIIDMMIGA